MLVIKYIYVIKVVFVIKVMHKTIQVMKVMNTKSPRI